MIRHQILDHLALNKGQYVSGEELSKRLKITRAAVWKHINLLKSEGYIIDAVPRKGYCLSALPQNIDPYALQYAFQAQGLQAWKLQYYETIPSTNDQAKQVAKQDPLSSAVIVARTQQSGKGRHGRTWSSPAGGLWMSILLHPNLSLADASKTTLAAGIGIIHALQELTGLEVQIKWPNDIVFQGRKLAGILGEVSGEWISVQNLILGIGINGNFSLTDLPPGVAGTTLSEIRGCDTDLNQLAALTVAHIVNQLRVLEREGFEPIRQSWMAAAVGIGQPVKIIDGKTEHFGVFSGIDEDGALILGEGKQQKRFTAGDVHLRSAEGGYDLSSDSNRN